MNKLISIIILIIRLALAAYIVPGGNWRDNNGNLVNAHAGGINYDERTGTFWLFGEYKVEGQTEGGGVKAYSSKDLAHWQDEGLALGEEIILPYIRSISG